MLDAEQARSMLRYDPETGALYRVTGPRAGRKIEQRNHNGYIYPRFAGGRHMAHRLIWLIVHGDWPQGEIDHINGDKADNRLKNLRVCSHRENMCNTAPSALNKSGIKGVSWCSRRMRWRAQISAGGRRKFLGYFADKEAAAEAYRDAGERLYGEFFSQRAPIVAAAAERFGRRDG